LGYADEIAELERFRPEDVDERIFLTEFAFVVLVSGFRYSSVRGLFERVSEAFLGFQDADRIASELDRAYNDAIQVFNHQRKLMTICQAICDVASRGFESFWRDLKSDWHSIERYDRVGPATALHLARNLGMDVAKPDRHLMRLAAALDISVAQLAANIALSTGDRIGVVDGVIWRFATIRPDFISFFLDGSDRIAVHS
jgi:hypothetical protein